MDQRLGYRDTAFLRSFSGQFHGQAGLAPFFALSAGYNLAVTSGITGGLMVGPTLEVTVRTFDRTVVALGVGYSGQRYEISYREKAWALRKGIFSVRSAFFVKI